jgi:anthranilate synthase component 2
MTILVIDNFDSFTYNLVHYLVELGARVDVRRNDAIGTDAALASDYAGIVISPGPGTPDGAGISLALVAACVDAHMPLLGVCLGHQAIAQHFGLAIARGGLMHGKTAPVRHDGSGVFAALPSPFTVTRYHSLLASGSCDSLVANAHDEAGAIMGLRHRALPIHGVQFHPESIATEHGHQLLGNFLSLCLQDPIRI